LYYVDKDTYKIIRELSETVRYVDVNPECTTHGDKWENIATGSKHYVWAQNCPVYTDWFHTNTKEILDNAWRILDDSGLVLFPKTDRMKDVSYFEKANDGRWKLDLDVNRKNVDVPFFIDSIEHTDRNNLIIFQKLPAALAAPPLPPMPPGTLAV
jgi:hypothetical protein